MGLLVVKPPGGGGCGGAPSTKKNGFYIFFWPVPDDLNDIQFGDPKELPGWVDRGDESTSDY